MQGERQVIAHLNAQLKNELTAINQYFLHSRTLRHQGYERLGKIEYDESIGEMKHADRLIERILVLGGLPNLQDLGKLSIGEKVPEILRADLGLENATQAAVKTAIAACEPLRDYVSREILDDIISDTEAAMMRDYDRKFARLEERLERQPLAPVGGGARAGAVLGSEVRRSSMIAPSRISMMRSACSATCMSCVTMMTVWPSA